MSETWKLNPEHEKIPDSLSIAKDGEAKRILGAWIGNNVDPKAIWAPTLTKIQNSLMRWEKKHPTIEEWKIIAQRMVGSMTQYLTVMQGMPKAIEENLIRQTCTFTWDNEGKPTIGLGTLTASIPDGGKQLLDIGMRNAAIEMMWIKGYLKTGDNRPSWAYFADQIFAKYATNEQLIVPPATRINHWLQTWHPVQKRLPGLLQRMS